MKIEKNKSPLKPKFPKVKLDKDKEVIHAFTDGACSGNGKDENVGGYGYLIVKGGEVVRLYTKATKDTTNNKMELQAIIDCLEYIEERRMYEPQIILHSDSQYCIHGICSWRHGWIAREWQGVKNIEQWKHLNNLVNILTNVQFKWVRAHQEDDSVETRYNCMIDEAIQECMFGEKKADMPGKKLQDISSGVSSKWREGAEKRRDTRKEVLREPHELLLAVYREMYDDSGFWSGGSHGLRANITEYLQKHSLIDKPTEV